MVRMTDIYQFIEAELEIQGDRLSEECDVFSLGETPADRCADFIAAYSKRFKVDLSHYRWYFHHGESGWNPGGFLVKPPYKRVARQPITPAILLQSAKKRRWKLQYPDHEIPQRRWDMTINKGILFFAMFFVIQRFLAPLLFRSLG